MLPIDPQDPTTGRGFLDAEPEGDPELLRSDFVALVEDFVSACLQAAPAAHPLPARATVQIEDGE
jgi:hypothetical protein